MNKIVNLDEIIHLVHPTRFGQLRDDKSLTIDDCKMCMREAINQALDLAAEEAKAYIYEENNEQCCEVDKDSILNIKHRVR